MILAAKRSAALIAMIRDYDPNEAVSVVAHSQGCLITLLAQAFLMETPGARPADTLILIRPRYSLEEKLVESMGLCHGGGEDEAMKGQYQRLGGQQTLKARMDSRGHGNGVRRHGMVGGVRMQYGASVGLILFLQDMQLVSIHAGRVRRHSGQGIHIGAWCGKQGVAPSHQPRDSTCHGDR